MEEALSGSQRAGGSGEFSWWTGDKWVGAAQMVIPLPPSNGEKPPVLQIFIVSAR
jgi:hypothetical protein